MQQEIERPQLQYIRDNAAETTQSNRRWRYSGRWLTLSVGFQKWPTSRTNTPDYQIAISVTSDLLTIKSGIFEETEQQSSVKILK